MNKKIKILYLITGLGVGGAEANLRDLVNGLDKERFDSCIISILSVGDIGKQIIDQGGRVISLSLKSKYDPRIVSRLVKIIRTERPDILHTQLFHADILGRFARLFVTVPVVISSLQNMTFGGKMHEFLLATTKRLVTRYIAVSQKVLDHAVHLGVADIKKSSVIYNAAGAAFFGSQQDKMTIREYLHLPKDKKIIIATGRLIPQKGFSDLISAMKLLEGVRPNEFVLYILGEGYLRADLENNVKSLNLINSVFLIGIVHNVKEYLNAADFFVLSSHWEGCPVALVEAAATALPVITTPVGAAPEFIKEGENGFIVPIGESKILAQKIIEISNLSKEELERTGRKASDDAKDLFSVKRMVDSHETLYVDCIKN